MTTFILLQLLVIALMGPVNTFRGGRFIEDERLPGRNLYYATPLVWILATLLWGPVTALLWALAYFLWAVMSWGHIIGMGRFQPKDRPPPAFERFYLRTGPIGAMVLRSLHVLPGLVIIALVEGRPGIMFLALPYAFLAAGVREVAWQVAENRYTGVKQSVAIMWGEVGEGFVWGALIVAALYIPRP